MAVLFLHIFVLAITDTVWFCQRDKCELFAVFASVILYYFMDDEIECEIQLNDSNNLPTDECGQWISTV